ncbi:MAG TPA: hypothetical protein VFG30_32135 [Polyangiales bacterium]|nr:hypothetical protein [Polyangiales bacterium]
MPILAGLFAPAVRALDSSCPELAVEVNPLLRSRWPDARKRVGETFEARDDIEACARVRLRLRGRSIVVDVVLPDGRVASRSVARREDVVPTLEALLLVLQPLTAEAEIELERAALPEPERQPAPPQPQPAQPATELTLASGRPVVDRGASSPTLAETSHSDSSLGFEFSIATGVRIGAGQVGLGLGALSFLDIAGWLLGVEGRVDQYQRVTDGLAAAALEIALLLGRRFRFDGLALDLTAGPAVALLQGGTEIAEAAPTPQPRVFSDSGVTARVLACARLNFSAHSVLRSFVGIDAAFEPAQLAVAEPDRNVVRLPGWSLGIAVGATVGTR